MKERVQLPRKIINSHLFKYNGGPHNKGSVVCFVDHRNRSVANNEERLYWFSRAGVYDLTTELICDDKYVWVKVEGDHVIFADGPADRQYPMYRYVLTDEDADF